MKRTTKNTPLARLRVAAGLTQEEAAGKMGVSLGGYRKLESGERRLKVEQIKKASEVFGVPVESVVTGIGSSIPPAIQNAFDRIEGQLTSSEERALLDILDLIVRSRRPRTSDTPDTE